MGYKGQPQSVVKEMTDWLRQPQNIVRNHIFLDHISRFTAPSCALLSWLTAWLDTLQLQCVTVDSCFIAYKMHIIMRTRLRNATQWTEELQTCIKQLKGTACVLVLKGACQCA